MTQELGPYQRAANKLLQFAIDRNVPNAAQIIVNGQLSEQWDIALKAIMDDDRLRSNFDYSVLREVRDDLIPHCGRFSFVGQMGQSFPGHFQFLKLVANGPCRGKRRTA